MAGPLFIAPVPGETPRPTPPASLGPCRWITDLETNQECGEVGTHKIKADSRIQQALIIVCRKHHAENNQKYAELRATRKTG